MKDLHRIRCYGKYYDPSEFKNRGWRGWWVRVLNRCRFWIECKVIYHVLLIQAAHMGPELADVKAILEHLESDVEAERTQFTQSRPRMQMPINHTGSAEGHLRELERRKKDILNPREHTAQVLQRYGSDPRSRKYAFSRNSKIMMEAELPQPQEITPHGETVTPFQPSRRSAREGSADRPVPEAAVASAPAQTGRTRTGRVRPLHPEYVEEDFTGFVGDDENTDYGIPGEDNIVAKAERLRTTSRDTAADIEEHQRSVLSRAADAAPDEQSHLGSDANREKRSPLTTVDAEEHRGEEGSAGTIKATAASRIAAFIVPQRNGTYTGVSEREQDHPPAESGSGSESGSGAPPADGA